MGFHYIASMDANGLYLSESKIGTEEQVRAWLSRVSSIIYISSIYIFICYVMLWSLLEKACSAKGLIFFLQQKVPIPWHCPGSIFADLVGIDVSLGLAQIYLPRGCAPLQTNQFLLKQKRWLMQQAVGYLNVCNCTNHSHNQYSPQIFKKRN